MMLFIQHVHISSIVEPTWNESKEMINPSVLIWVCVCVCVCECVLGQCHSCHTVACGWGAVHGEATAMFSSNPHKCGIYVQREHFSWRLYSGQMDPYYWFTVSINSAAAQSVKSDSEVSQRNNTSTHTLSVSIQIITEPLLLIKV